MLRDIIRRHLTRHSKVSGSWTQTSPTTAQDSALGECRLEPEGFYALIPGYGEVHVSMLPGNDMSEAYTYARSVLVNLPKLDGWYRRFAAADVHEFHRLLGPSTKLSKRQLAEEFKLSWLQLWDPCSDGATIWYSAGNLLGDSRVGVQLDAQRRYRRAGVG